MRMIAGADVAPVCFPGTAEFWKASSAWIKFSKVGSPLPASSPLVQSTQTPQESGVLTPNILLTLVPLELSFLWCWTDSWRDGLLIHSHIEWVFFSSLGPQWLNFTTWVWNPNRKPRQEIYAWSQSLSGLFKSKQVMSTILSQSSYGSYTVGNRCNMNFY